MAAGTDRRDLPMDRRVRLDNVRFYSSNKIKDLVDIDTERKKKMAEEKRTVQDVILQLGQQCYGYGIPRHVELAALEFLIHCEHKNIVPRLVGNGGDVHHHDKQILLSLKDTFPVVYIAFYPDDNEYGVVNAKYENNGGGFTATSKKEKWIEAIFHHIQFTDGLQHLISELTRRAEEVLSADT